MCQPERRMNDGTAPAARSSSWPPHSAPSWTPWLTRSWSALPSSSSASARQRGEPGLSMVPLGRGAPPRPIQTTSSQGGGPRDLRPGDAGHRQGDLHERPERMGGHLGVRGPLGRQGKRLVHVCRGGSRLHATGGLMRSPVQVNSLGKWKTFAQMLSMSLLLLARRAST